MNENMKTLGVASITLTWIIIAILLYKFRGNRSMSISKHAASFKKSYLMMAVMESLVLPAYVLFVVEWFSPTFNLHPLFTVSTILAATGLLIAAWIPDTTDWKALVHKLAAYGAAVMYIPATIVLYLSPNISTVARTLSLINLMYQLASIVLFISTKRAKEFHLYIQITYMLLYHILIIVTIYS